MLLPRFHSFALLHLAVFLAAEGSWDEAEPYLAEAYLLLDNIDRAGDLIQRRIDRFRAHKHRRAQAPGRATTANSPIFSGP